MRLDWHDNGKTIIIAIVAIAATIIVLFSLIISILPSSRLDIDLAPAIAMSELNIPKVEEFKVTHTSTPQNVKAVYMTSWAAGNEKFRKHLFDLIDNTEINSVVIDVKDYTGRISFPVKDPMLVRLGSAENRIPDIERFIGSLHDKGVYVIARISSFQDSYLINIHPEWAVKNSAGEIWKDYKGVKWLDPGENNVWAYLVAIGREAYSVGFDELNFDYIRFPSDGNMLDIYFPKSHGLTKTEVMKSFYRYLDEEFATSSIPISADLFGLTTSASGDLGIGQNLEDAIKYFDYVSPMVYPSHYSAGYNGLTKPALYPYEVVNSSMNSAIVKAYNASTTPMKIRPWLQDFNLGAVYTPAMVRAQIQATYDSGLDSWMLWNAGSVYQKDALIPKSEMVI